MMGAVVRRGPPTSAGAVRTGGARMIVPVGERDDDRGRAAGADAGVSVVSVGDGADDGESEAGAVAGAVGGAGEAIKGRRLKAGREAGPVVGDREVDAIGVLTQAGSDGAFSMEQGVVEEVAERLLDAGRVGLGDERFGVDEDRAPGRPLPPGA